MKGTLAARWFASGLTILTAWACSANSNNGLSDGFGGSGSAGSGNGTGSGGSGAGNGTGSGGLLLVGSGSNTSTDASAIDGGCPKVFATPEAIEVPITIPLTNPVTTPLTVPVTTPVTTPITIPITVPITTTVRGPLDMYIMYDQSGSMGQGTPEKWTAIKDALIGFMNDPASADVGMGIQYFPLDAPACQSYTDPGCTCLGFVFLGACIGVPVATGGGNCNVSVYATPDVPIQLLPGVAPAITTSLNNHSPGGGTPTEPALQGAIQYAKQWATANPTRNGLPLKTVVVLATDGDPNDCSSDVPGVSAIAASGFSGTPSIQTFVIGVGSSLTSLNAIAQAGGTSQAIIVDTSNNPTQQFIDALNTIRDTSTVTGTTTVYVDGGTTTAYVDAGTTTVYVDGGTRTVYVDGGTTTVYSKLPCEWNIPEVPPAAGTFDKNLVNVTYNGTTIGFVQDPASCVAGTDAWHYDDYANPTKVMLCPSTCDEVKAADASAVPNIEVYFGCQTQEIFQ